MTDPRPDVRLVGDTQHVVDVERALGETLIGVLALAARRHNVMISLTISPYVDDEPEGERRG